MKKTVFLLTAFLPLLAMGQAQDAKQPLSTRQDPAKTGEKEAPPMLGINWARGFSNARVAEARRRQSSVNLIFHGGKIMPTANVQAIFWGTSWDSSAGDKISGMDTWYTGFSGSNYAQTDDEWTGTNGQVGPTISYAGHIVDTTQATGSDTATVLAEVCKAIPNPDPGGNGYYPVYSDLPRGAAGFCAYHSHGTCGGTPVQFGFFFDLDGDPGCDPQDASGLHSQGLAAIANVSGHELSEARSDPATPGAWFDAQGEENGDKCNFTFGVPLVTFSDGTQWKIQGEWSNIAFNNGTGFPNSAGQKGCLTGQ